MPITRRQFDLGVDSVIEEWMERLYDFLKEHKDQAYTIDELKASSGLPAAIDSQHQLVWQALEVLVKVSAVEIREVRGVYYHAFKSPVKKGSWEQNLGDGRG